MKTQQVPNSPYFIHYDDDGYCSVSRDKDDKEPIPESEMQMFLDAVANGLLYIEKEQRADTSVLTKLKKQLLPVAKRKAKKTSSSPQSGNWRKSKR